MSVFESNGDSRYRIGFSAPMSVLGTVTSWFSVFESVLRAELLLGSNVGSQFRVGSMSRFGFCFQHRFSVLDTKSVLSSNFGTNNRDWNQGPTSEQKLTLKPRTDRAGTGTDVGSKNQGTELLLRMYVGLIYYSAVLRRRLGVGAASHAHDQW